MHPLLVDGMGGGVERRVHCCQITRTNHRFACLWQLKNSTQLWYAPFLISWLLVTWNNMSTRILNCTKSMSLQPVKSTRLFTAYCLSCLNYTTKYQLYRSGTVRQHARNWSALGRLPFHDLLISSKPAKFRKEMGYFIRQNGHADND